MGQRWTTGYKAKCVSAELVQEVGVTFLEGELSALCCTCASHSKLFGEGDGGQVIPLRSHQGCEGGPVIHTVSE